MVVENPKYLDVNKRLGQPNCEASVFSEMFLFVPRFIFFAKTVLVWNHSFSVLEYCNKTGTVQAECANASSPGLLLSGA